MKKIKKLKVSVGIPAFNEEKNITFLLKSILSQKRNNFSLKEILLYTDGSTDNTIKFAESVKDKRIKIKIGKNRRGQQVRQNEILKDFKGDILVIMEADILPYNEFTISELVRPFYKNKSKKPLMVIGSPKLVKPAKFFEKILWAGYQMKFEIFKNWKEGKNVYTCGGHSMKALNRPLAEKMRWPVNVPEDSFLYFTLLKNNFSLERSAKAKSLVRNVTNLKDRLRQTKKFMSGKNILKRYFDQVLIQREYEIPKKIIISYLLKNFFKRPILITLYLIEVLINRIINFKSGNFDALYKTYDSSKLLIYKK